jgi:hypothetical protein
MVHDLPHLSTPMQHWHRWFSLHASEGTSLKRGVKLVLASAVEVSHVVQRHGLTFHRVVLAIAGLNRLDLQPHHGVVRWHTKKNFEGFHSFLRFRRC